MVSRSQYFPFFHHYQGSIDFNTVNIHRTVWVYFLIFPGSRDGILSEMIFKDHIIQYTPCSLGSVQGNTSLGTVFLDTLPRGNIRNTSSRGKHLQCSSNDAEKHNVDICRQSQNAITLVVLIRQNLNNRNKISYKKF